MEEGGMSLKMEPSASTGHYELGLRMQIGAAREAGDADWADWAEGLLNAKRDSEQLEAALRAISDAVNTMRNVSPGDGWDEVFIRLMSVHGPIEEAGAAFFLGESNV